MVERKNCLLLHDLVARMKHKDLEKIESDRDAYPPPQKKD